MKCEDFALKMQKLELGRTVCPPPVWALENEEIQKLLLPKPGLPRVALTGGIASGKSAVAEVFCLLGAAHIDFDVLAKTAVTPDSEGWTGLYELLGASYFLPDGSLNRVKTAHILFKKAEIKASVESIIHPITWRLMGEELKQMNDKPLVISIPLLFEAGLETFFNRKLLVFAAADVQLHRLMARDRTLSRRRAKRIIASQWPTVSKISGVDYVIDNSGAIGSTIKSAGAVWRYIMEPSTSPTFLV